jgi:WD40 repeat protein
MSQTIESSTIRILNLNGKTVGTGFLVSQDLAVTCAHVVVAADAIDGDAIQVQFTGKQQKISGVVLAQYWRDIKSGDIAFIRLDAVPEEVTPLRLALAANSHANSGFHSFGYATAADIQGIHVNGKIDGYLKTHQLLQLQSIQANHGVSGGPVFDEARNVVIGMINRGHTGLGRNQGTTFATPSELLFEICPEIKPSETCPYLGLETFTAETTRFFFGREALTEKLIVTLRDGCRFLAVFGPSGSGKSSVVRAGLLPKIAAGLFADWKQVIIRPADQPFEQMKTAGLDSFENISSRTILFIDQFEELFTLCPDVLRQEFVEKLARALGNPRFMLIISMRDDFYSAFNAKAAPLAASEHIKVENIPGTLKRDELLAMIEKPAGVAGLALEEGLAEIILKDLARDGEARSSTLPLLEFTLAQLWESRRDGFLTREAYQEIGGVTGSLARWADDAYSALPKESQFVAQSLLTSLVHLGDKAQGLPDTRRSRSLAEFDGTTREIIVHFVDRRLLVTEGEAVELVHDALVREWGRLRDFVETDRDNLRLREGVSDAAQAWRKNPKNQDLLVHHGGRLDDALKLKMLLTTQEQDYLAACKSSEQRRRRLIAITLTVTAIILAGILLGWGWTSNQYAGQLENQIATQNVLRNDLQISSTQSASEFQQRQQISREKEEYTLSQYLFSEAQRSVENGNLEMGLLLAIQSNKIYRNPDLSLFFQNHLDKLQPYIAKLSHSQQVLMAQFSLDHTVVFSVTADNTVHAWDVASGKEKYQWQAPETVQEIGQDETSSYLYVLGQTRLSVLNSAKGDLIQEILFGDEWQAHYKSQNWRWVAITTKMQPNQLTLFDTENGKTVMQLPYALNMVSFSLDEKYLAMYQDGIFSLINLENGQTVIKNPVNSARKIVFSPKNRIVVVVGSPTLVFDIASASVAQQIQTEIRDIAFVNDRVMIAIDNPPTSIFLGGGPVVKTKTEIQVWDTVSWQIITNTRQLAGSALSSPSVYSELIATADQNEIAVWNYRTGETISTHKLSMDVAELMWDPDRMPRWLAVKKVSGNCDQEACEYNLETIAFSTGTEGRDTLYQQSIPSYANKLYEFSPDRLMVAGWYYWGNDIYVWNSQPTLNIIWGFHGQSDYSKVDFSPDGKKFFLDDNIQKMPETDLKTGYTTSRFSLKPETRKSNFPLVFNPVRNFLAISDEIWDLDQEKLAGSLTANGAEINAAQSTRDGKFLVYGNSDGTVNVAGWDNGAVIHTARITGAVQWLDICNDSELVVASDEKYAVILNLADLSEKRRVNHETAVNQVAFSADCKLVMSKSEDLIKLWDASSGNVINSIGLEPSARIIVSPKKNYLVVSYYSTEKTSLEVYSLSTLKKIDQAVFAYAQNISFSADDQWMATAGGPENRTDIWRTSDWSRVASLLQQAIKTWTTSFSPDGKRIAITSPFNSIVRIIHWEPTDLITIACERVTRNLTRTEWRQYVGDAKTYAAVCPNLPLEPEPTATPAP